MGGFYHFADETTNLYFDGEISAQTSHVALAPGCKIRDKIVAISVLSDTFSNCLPISINNLSFTFLIFLKNKN